MSTEMEDEGVGDFQEIVDIESSSDGGSENEIMENSKPKDPAFLTRKPSDNIPKIGMVFKNEEEAYNFYNQYAWDTGFSIRRGQYRRLADGTVRKRLFLCDKEGYRKVRSTTGKVNRLETRTGCKAMIQFILEKDEWIVEKVVLEHNHGPSTEQDMLRSHRRVSKAQGDVISTLDNAGVGASGIYSYFVEEAGGPEYVGFQKSDCNNFLRNKRLVLLEAGDAQAVINHFKDMQTDDPSFFYTMQVDAENRLTNFFWRDGRSKIDYKYLCDVVIFDTTYRTNKYNMIFAPFIGVNHHRQNVLLGCAFLLDETTESFVWLFKAFLEAMGGQQPVSFFTDQCSAMANAVAKVFPNTQHRLCLWHIGQNAVKHLSHYYGKQGFKSHFHKCLYECETEQEFEEVWGSMINKYGLAENKWLDGLYKLRAKWCGVFSKDCFSAGIYSTQRSESMNNIFKKVTSKTMPLIKFVLRYEKVNEKRRRAELVEDVRCNQGAPSGVGRVGGIIKQAADLYTHAMFKIFQEELYQCISIALHEMKNDGDKCTYKLVKEGGQREYIVKFHPLDHTLECNCKKFEVEGILCCHSLRVMNARNIFSMPEKYILKRWTKSAKCGVVEDEKMGSITQKTKRPVRLRMSRIMHKAVYVASKGALTDEASSLAEQLMEIALEKIEDLLKSKDDVGLLEKTMESDNDDGVKEKACLNSLTDEMPILNPPHIRSKGMRNTRMKGVLEKKIQRNGSIRKVIKSPKNKRKTSPKTSTLPTSRGNKSSRNPKGPVNILPKPLLASNQFISPFIVPGTHIGTNSGVQALNMISENLCIPKVPFTQSSSTGWQPNHFTFPNNQTSHGYPAAPFHGQITPFSQAYIPETSSGGQARIRGLQTDHLGNLRLEHEENEVVEVAATDAIEGDHNLAH